MIFEWQAQPWKDWTRLRERLPHAILIQSGEGLGELEFARACAQSLLWEPPPATVFLLVTTQPERLLATVRSRCMRFALPFPPSEPVLRWLKEQGLEHPEATLAGAGGAPLAALKAAGTDPDRLVFIESLG